MVRYVKEPARRLPVAGRYDVVVAGGGPGGIGAALAAARAGMKVILLEQTGCLGGLSTAGLVPCFAPYTYSGSDPGRPTYGGIAFEVLERLRAAGGGGEPTEGLQWPTVDGETLKLVFDRMIAEAKVRVLFFTFVSDVIRQRGRLKAVVIENKAGRQAVTGRVFIDATGDADVAARAGAPFDKGDAKGRMQAATLCFTVAGVDVRKYWTFYRRRFKVNACMTRWLKECERDGRLASVPGTEYRMIAQKPLSASVMGLNFGHVFGIDGTDPADLTRVMIAGRQLAHNYIAFARRHIPGMARARIVATASLAGIRETRRVRGRRSVTLDDFNASRHATDDVAVCDYPIDVHPATGARTDTERTERDMETLVQPAGASYGIPFRSLLPGKVDNLLVVGRSISTDRMTQGSTRIIPACFTTGQAAGTAAALAIRRRVSPARIDVRRLRAELTRAGARIK